LIVAVTILGTLCFASDTLFDRIEFETFKLKYNKKYDTVQEELRRFHHFSLNLEMKRKHKELEISELFDLSEDEIHALGFQSLLQQQRYKEEKIKKAKEKLVRLKKEEEIRRNTVPKSWDWRFDGLINGTSCITNDTFNEGQCSAMWAYASVQQIVSIGFLEKNLICSSPLLLSIQQILDCDYESAGCGGGFPSSVFEYVRHAGLEASACYQYQGMDQSCRFNQSCVAILITGYKFITESKDEQAIQHYVGTTGPVLATIYLPVFQQGYNGTVITGDCGQNQGDVQIMGYDTINGTDAWIVKSNLETMGYPAYLYLARGNNVCGIANCPLTVTTQSVNARKFKKNSQ